MAVPRKSKIYFFFEKPLRLENRTELKKFLENIFKRHGKKLSYLNYIFCSDEYLRTINREYLRHDYYTDIVSFELSGIPGLVEGEIYISGDRVKENALDLKTSFINELHRVIFHGALHLCGFKDKNASQAFTMRQKEELLLREYLKVPRKTVSQ